MAPGTDEIKPCLIHIDKEGCWTHKGAEMIRRDLIQLFYRNMELDSEGQYIINWQGTQCYVDVEDTAFVVTRVLFGEKTRNGKPGFVLNLSDGTRENLLPETLCTGNDNVLYCRIKNNTFPARFLRQAYYQLAEYIEEENGNYVIRLDGRKYSIKRT
ncbi:MAG TPA: DUF1285 domain-containing protein [Deltaproteobacteria bacterium]|nr:DUF1285 domain-containing protein [Deltaproteobacteria bacterium]